MVKLALSMYGHMYADLSAGVYRNNAMRAIDVSTPWGVTLRTAHVSGVRYNLSDLFNTVHVSSGASVDGTSNLARMREKLTSVFKALEKWNVRACLLMRIDVYIDELASPATYGLHTVNNLNYGPWDGLIYGAVSKLSACGLQSAVSGQPESLLVECCQRYTCRQFRQYRISLVKPANGSRALRSQQVRTWSRSPGQPSQHQRRNLIDFFREQRKGLKRMNTTAVVAVGGLRSLIYTDVARRLQTRVLTPLSADLFLYVDTHQIQWASKLNYSTYNRCDAHSRMPKGVTLLPVNYLHNVNPIASGEFNDCQAFGDVLPHTTSNTSKLWLTAAEKVRPMACGFFKYRRCMAQFLWADEAFSLVRKHEQARGQRYEWVVKVRPDMIFDYPMWLPRKGGNVVYGYHYRTYMILDWWAVMPREVADVYFSMGAAMRRCDELTWGADASKCSGLKKDDVECFLYRWLRSHGIHVDNQWGRAMSSTLVHIEGNARTTVSSASFAAG